MNKKRTGFIIVIKGLKGSIIVEEEKMPLEQFEDLIKGDSKFVELTAYDLGKIIIKTDEIILVQEYFEEFKSMEQCASETSAKDNNSKVVKMNPKGSC